MKLNIIAHNSEFRRIYASGKGIPERNLVMYASPRRLTHARFGVSVSGKVGNAVVRNRLRRQIKEIIRLNLSNISDEYDIIFIVRPRCAGSNFAEIRASIMYLLKKRRLLLDPKNIV